MNYSIDEHKHRYSAWAASRAASVKNCRFEVADGKEIIEAIGLRSFGGSPDALPEPNGMDSAHRRWRDEAIAAANRLGVSNFSHGIAAKLINVYLKGMVVCGGHHNHPRAVNLHPPIDRLLLDALYANNVGGSQEAWRNARAQRWSKFTSDQYEAVIAEIKRAMAGSPLWRVESHWRGFQ
jgi:hypothetical protein